MISDHIANLRRAVDDQLSNTVDSAGMWCWKRAHKEIDAIERGIRLRDEALARRNQEAIP